MKSQLNAVVDELKRLKYEGVEGVYVSEETLTNLKSKLAEIKGTVPESADGAEAVKKAKTPETPVKSAPTESSEPDPLKAVLGNNPIGIKSSEKPVGLNQHGKPIATLPEPPVVELVEGDKQTRWDALKEVVVNDAVCQEHLNPDAQVVFGVGSLDAEIFFCGEAPGADEEKQGIPFIGKAGDLLTKIITAMGVDRDKVYIGNIMNWRPELPTSSGNRPPMPEEMAYCLPYLKAQIDVVKPKVIVALGMTAVNGLIGADPKRRMGDIRGKFSEFNGVPLMVTYHPSYLLRYASMKTKRLVWEDMMTVMEKIGLPISEKQKRFFS